MLKIVAFPLFLLVALSALFFVLLLPSDKFTDKAVNLLMWLAVTGVITAAMVRTGKQFVDYPTLVRLPPANGQPKSKDQ